MGFWQNTKDETVKKTTSEPNNFTAFKPREAPNYDNFVYCLDVFTKEECEKIIKYGEMKGVEQARIGGDNVNPKIRNSEVVFFQRTSETEWVFEKFSRVLDDVNSNWYGFELTCFAEGAQFTRYTEGQFYHWHQDMSADNSTRKLSIVVNLSPSESYKGGDLQFFSLRDKPVPREQGSVIIFPSFENHRVKAVTEGTRYSLVCWVAGPAFR